MSDDYMKQFATQTFNLYQGLKGEIAKKNTFSRVMMRVVDKGKGVEIGFIPSGNADAQRAFAMGESVHYSTPGINDIHSLYIPVPSEGGTQQIGGRAFENKTFIGAPVGFEKATGTTINIGAKQYQRYTPSDLLLHSFANPQAVSEITNIHGRIGNISRELYEMHNKIDTTSYTAEQMERHKNRIVELTESLAIAQDSLQKAVNHRQNAVIKLLSSSDDAEWIVKTANMGAEQVNTYTAAQAGTIADMLAGNKLQFRMADAEGKEYLGFTLLDKMSEQIGELIGEGADHINYIKDARKVKGELPGVDIRKLTPFGNYIPMLSPRPLQYHQHVMLDVGEAFRFEKEHLGATKDMQKVLDAGAAKVAKSGYTQHSIPAMGARISFKDSNTLSDIVEHLGGGRRPGLTIEESSMVLKSTIPERVTGTRDIQVTIAKHLVDSTYSKGSVIEHGAKLGVDKAGKEILYHHPLEMTSQQMKEALLMHGVQKTPSQLQTTLKDIKYDSFGNAQLILQEPVNVMPGVSIYGEGTKGTANILYEKYFDALGLPYHTEYMMSHREQAKETRNMLGSILESHANLSTMVLRNDRYAESVGKFHGITAQEAKAEAASIHKLLGVQYDQMTGRAILPTSVIKPGGTIEDIGNVIKQVEQHRIAQYVNKSVDIGGGKIIQYAAQLTAANLNVASEAFFARLTGAFKNKMWEGASLTGLEGNMFELINAPGLAEQYVKNLNKANVEVVSDMKKAIQSISGVVPATGEPVYKLSTFDPIKRQPGGGYSTGGFTILDKIEREGGMHLELPFTGHLDITSRKGKPVGDITSGIQEVKSVYIPRLNAYHQGEAIMDKYAGLLSELHGITSQEGTDQWLQKYGNYLREDIAGGKQSVVASALRSTHDFSAVMRVAPTAMAEPATTIMHPDTIKRMLGEHGEDIMQHFASKGEDFLIGLHRFPTTYTTSFGVTKLQANRYADPHRIFTDIGSWSLSKGDFDADLAIAFEMMGLSRERLNKLHATLSELESPLVDPKERIALRKAELDKIFDELTNTQQYTDLKRLYTERKTLAAEASDAIRAQYYNQTADTLNRDFAASSVFAREAVSKGFVSYNEKLGAYQATMLDARMKYGMTVGEQGMGTKGVAGIVSNYSLAMQNMTSEVYGATPKAEVIDKAMLAYNFAGAIYDTSLSTKTERSPARVFEEVMHAGQYEDVGKLKSKFISSLKEEKMLEPFATEIGKAYHPNNPLKAYGKGMEAVDAMFDVFLNFSKQHGEELLGEGTTYVSPAAYKNIYERQGYLRGVNVSNKMGIGQAANIRYEGTNLSASLANAMTDVKPVGKQLLGDIETSLSHIKSNKGLFAAAAIGATMIGTVAIGSALSGSPKLSRQTAIPPIQRPSTRDTIYGEPQPTYETTIINVRGKTKRPVEGLDRLTMMALQNSMPVRLDGSININDNRIDAGNIVNEALMRML